jgi:hypothetical protein
MADNEQRRTRAKAWAAEIDAARRRAASDTCTMAGRCRLRSRWKPSPRIARAAVVISPREAQLPGAAKLIDRQVWRTNCAIALRWTGTRNEESTAHPAGYERPVVPWAASRRGKRIDTNASGGA